VILDSGAVVALARCDPIVRAFIERALTQRDLVVVPTVVIAETTRGDAARDASVNRSLRQSTK
jgi:Trp operon repressor